MILLSSAIAALALLNNIYLDNIQNGGLDYEPPVLKEKDIDDYKKIGDDLYKTIQQLLSSKEWEDGIYGEVQSATLNGTLYFSSQLQVDVPPEVMFQELWENGEQTPSWNPQAEFVKELLNIEDDIKIMYQTVDAKVPGFSAKRDFITLKRRVIRLDGARLMLYKSINFPLIPEREGYVRGMHGPSSMIVYPFPNEPSTNSLRWIMNTDPQFMWMPKRIQDGIMKATMPLQISRYLELLKNHTEALISEHYHTKKQQH